MKTKNDFVTNSSSTSFIITNKSKNIGKGKITIEIDFDSNHIYNETFTTLEELKKCDRFDWFDDEELADDKHYQECIKAIEKGRVVHIIDASNEGEGIEIFLCERGIRQEDFVDQDIKIIFGEGGF